MNSMEKDIPSYEELALELARQVKFNEVDEYSNFEDISEEVCSQKVDNENIFFEDISEEDTIKKLGRKKFWNLTLLKPFVDILKYKTQTKTISILSLSCNSKFWKMVYKNHRYVSRLFQLAQEVQLIKCVDNTYRFNTKRSNRSKMYAWNKKQEKVLLSLFKKYHITDKFIQSLSSINYSYLISIVDTFGKDNKKQDLVEAKRRFNIRIAQRTCLPLSDEIIAAAINERYPQYIAMCKTIAEDNAMKPIDEMDYANLNIKRDKNKNAISISIRKTNQYCPAKVKDITNEDRISGKRAIRDDILMKKFGAVYENDVKSSIYRITYLLNNGVWLDNSIDLYERIFGAKFKSKEDRKIFKAPFCMQLYFNTSSKSMKAHIEYKKSKTKKWNAVNYGYTIIEKARDNMFKAIGKSWYSEIFLHESCIYTQVAHRLRLLGYKVIQIYDGFFTDKYLDNSEFNRIVKEEAMKYYKTYINKDTSCSYQISNNNSISNINSGHIRESKMKRSNKHKIDNSDIPTEEDFKREEQERYAKLDKKYKFSSLLAMAEHGDISSKDLNILLEAFKFKYLRAKPCKLGFTPSNTSIAFKKFVNYTISRIKS